MTHTIHCGVRPFFEESPTVILFQDAQNSRGFCLCPRLHIRLRECILLAKSSTKWAMLNCYVSFLDGNWVIPVSPSISHWWIQQTISNSRTGYIGVPIRKPIADGLGDSSSQTLNKDPQHQRIPVLSFSYRENKRFSRFGISTPMFYDLYLNY